MTSLTGGQIALGLFGLSPTGSLGASLGSGFPGGSIAYYNYLAKNGANLLKQSNNSQQVASQVAYFQGRVAQITPPKPTTLVRVNANLPQLDPAGTSHTANATVFDNKGDKFTVAIRFTQLGTVGQTDSWAASIISATAAPNNPDPKITARVVSGNQTLNFDITSGNFVSVTPGPGTGQAGVSLGVITTSDNQVLQPKFSVAGGGTTGGNVTVNLPFFTVNSVQSNGNPPVPGPNNIKTVDDVFKDPKLLNFILTATGLGDQTQNLGLVKKALTQDPTKPGAIANQLSNKKFLSADQTLQLYKGISALHDPQTIQSLINNFQVNTFEQGIAQTDQSVANARYFARNVSGVVATSSTTTNAALSILGDRVLREVVTTALGFPKQLAVLPVGDQAAAIKSRVDVSQFKNPAFVAKFVTRYLTQVQTTQFQADLGTSSDTALSLLTAPNPNNFR